MVEDKKLEHQHDFDGIEELDNDLPRWWLGTFWVTIIFAFFYWPYYHMMHPEKLPMAAYDAEQAALAGQKTADTSADSSTGSAASSAMTEEQLLAAYDAGGWEESGKAVFASFCMPCHLADGGGQIGPNLTDDYAIHGGKLTDLVHIITEGVPEKGMVPWKSQLKPDQIRNLAYYVKSLRGTTPAAGKEPQGQKMDEAGNFIE